MTIRSKAEIYQILEEILRETKEPLTCNDIWDQHLKVREAEPAGARRISDILGFMWRKGIVIRYTLPKTRENFARYGYTWKVRPEEKIEKLPDVPQPEAPIVCEEPTKYLKVTEIRNGVVIDYNNLKITVQTK
jgi:hypothetical protein